MVCSSFSIHGSVDALLKGRQIVLMPCVLDMPLELRLSPNKVHSTAKTVSRRSHCLRIRIRFREHAAAQKPGNPVAVDLIVLHLPALNRLHLRSITELKGDAEQFTQIGDPGTRGRHNPLRRRVLRGTDR